MKDIKMADIAIHIDETLDDAQREDARDSVLGLDGVMAAAFNNKTPHMMIVEFDPDRVTTAGLLKAVTDQGVHAELVGL